MKPKKITVMEYWNEKGIDYETISKIIDIFPEGHDITELAKDLISALDDYSFEDKGNN